MIAPIYNDDYKMPYSSIAQIPATLKGAGLSLSQANDWARYYDDGNNAAIAWTRFKLKYKKVGDKWTMKAGQSLYKEPIHTMSMGIGSMVLNSIDNNICRFSFIVQTEGIHQGIGRNKVMYTKEFFNKWGNTLIGKNVYDDPKHSGSIGDNRKIGDGFALIKNVDIKQINDSMIAEFNIDNSLVGKYALIAHAEGYDAKFNYLIRNNGIKYFSSEFTYNGSKDKSGVWHPTHVNYDGVVALMGNHGADPGAVMLDIYNAKYGGNKMTDEKVSELEKEIETQKVKNAELEKTLKSVEDIKTKNTELEDEKKKIEDEKVAMETKNSELEDKVKELSKGEFDLEQAKSEIDGLSTKNIELEGKVEELEKNTTEIESLNTQIKEMRDEKRITTLQEHVKNDKIVESIISQDLDDKAFNAKIEEIKLIKEEAKVNAAIPNGGVAINNYDTTKDDYEKFWGGSRDDMIKEVTGG